MHAIRRLKCYIVLLCFISNVTNADINNAQRELDALVSSMPKGLFEDIILHQQKLLGTLQKFHSGKLDLISENELLYKHDTRAVNSSSHDANVRIGIIFIGFPTESLRSIKTLWFNGINDIVISKSSSYMPKGISIDSLFDVQFDFVETSFHLDDAFQQYMEAISRSMSSEDRQETIGTPYLNQWDVDALISSLHNELLEDNIDGISGHIDSAFSRLSGYVYVLNVGNQNRNNYTYENGYSSNDLHLLQHDESCVAAARKVLRNKMQSLSRRVAHASSLASDVALSSHWREVVEKVVGQGEKEAFGEPSGAFIQEVKASRLWANRAMDSVQGGEQISLYDRAKLILEGGLSEDERAAAKEPFLGARKIFKYPEGHAVSLALQILQDDTLFGSETSLGGSSGLGPSSLWMSDDRTMWMDINAVATPPPDTVAAGDEAAQAISNVLGTWSSFLSKSHLVRQYSGNEHTASVTGQESETEFQSLRALLDRHVSRVGSLMEQLRCEQLMHVKSFVEVGDNVHKTILQCTLLKLDYSMLFNVQQMSQQSADSLHTLVHTRNNRALDAETYIYVNDIKRIHNILLSVALEEANVFVGKAHFTVGGFSDEMTNHAVSSIAHLIHSSVNDICSVSSQPPSHAEKESTEISPVELPDTPVTTLLEFLKATSLDSYHTLHSNSHSITSSAIVNHLLSGVAHYVPTFVDVDVYVIRLQKSYEPTEPIYGFDMPTFLNEIMRLRLSNQNFDVTVHYISDTSEEMSLSLGLAACLANSSDTASVNVLSGDCLWRFVRHQEKRSYRGKGRVTKQDLHLSKRQTLNVFILSIDTAKPTLLARNSDLVDTFGLKQSLAFRDGVLIVQNKHRIISRAGLANSWSGRNPVSGALEAFASSLLGVHLDGYHSSRSRSRIHGTSPLLHPTSTFIAVTSSPARYVPYSPRFSATDIDRLHRTRLLASASFFDSIFRYIELGSWMSDLPRANNQSGAVRGHLATVALLYNACVDRVSAMDWSTAASISNAMAEVGLQALQDISNIQNFDDDDDDDDEDDEEEYGEEVGRGDADIADVKASGFGNLFSFFTSQICEIFISMCLTVGLILCCVSVGKTICRIAL